MTRKRGEANNSQRAEILKEKEHWGIDDAIFDDAKSHGRENVDPEEIKRDIDEKIVKVIASLMS